jgi:hypothetical protein
MERVMTVLAGQCAVPEAAALAVAWLGLAARVRDDERGMTTETVIITAGLSALAVAVVAIIVSRVTSRARSIQ